MTPRETHRIEPELGLAVVAVHMDVWRLVAIACLERSVNFDAVSHAAYAPTNILSCRTSISLRLDRMSQTKAS